MGAAATGTEGSTEAHDQSADEIKADKPKTREIKWRMGDMEFEAYMRMLDNSVSCNSEALPTSNTHRLSFVSFAIVAGLPNRLPVPHPQCQNGVATPEA
jgi:hypothetical protein